MIKVKLIPIGDLTNLPRLKLIKIIKNYTGYGLKYSKDFMDVLYFEKKSIEIEISESDKYMFKNDLAQFKCIKYHFKVTRDDNLLKLGIADKKDYIDYVTDNDIINDFLNYVPKKYFIKFVESKKEHEL